MASKRSITIPIDLFKGLLDVAEDLKAECEAWEYEAYQIPVGEAYQILVETVDAATKYRDAWDAANKGDDDETDSIHGSREGGK